MYLIVKRILDIVFSLLLILASSPFLLMIGLLIKVESKGPILFKQKRIGLHKTNFTILKYRTMVIDAPDEMPTHLFGDSKKYITRIGRILRKISLDELPQLFNILVGDMSFVGPRPALWNQFDLIEERDKYSANDIMPGLIGWAQINGRDSISIEDKAALDGEYVKNLSLMFDLKCFWGACINVITRAGILEGHEIIEEEAEAAERAS